MREFWLDVVDDDRYEVSNMGRVRNKRNGRILATHANRPNGYLRVTIDGKHKYIHRLVADAFFAGDHDNLDVNHIDGDKNNNFLGNLEWCTRKENTVHAFENGLRYPIVKNVVRCKFCRHRLVCELRPEGDDGFYCAYGER